MRVKLTTTKMIYKKKCEILESLGFQFVEYTRTGFGLWSEEFVKEFMISPSTTIEINTMDELADLEEKVNCKIIFLRDKNNEYCLEIYNDYRE